MQMNGEVLVKASREIVWAALNDPEILRQCIPGCESLTKDSDSEMAAKVTTRIGPIKASFSGKVTLSELDPPKSYVISGEGSGGAAGFAKGRAAVRLATAVDGTLLSYDVDSAVGGKIAQIGARLVEATARKMADEFFGKFATLVEITTPLLDEPAPLRADSASSQRNQSLTGNQRPPALVRLILGGIAFLATLCGLLYSLS
ncbi:CoxG family protein [Ferrovibrio sp.]|uniref:CoxG family protein n=1 Tax=Ferrovibrio sp. TaxID=1917215 RepID=UPI003D26C58C